MVGGSVSTVRFIRCRNCKFLLTEFDGIPLLSCSECRMSLQDKEEPSNFDTQSVGSRDDINVEEQTRFPIKGNSNLRTANRTTGLSRRTIRSRAASRELEEGINTKTSLNFETKPRGPVPGSALSFNNSDRAMSVYSDDILSDDHRMGSEIGTSFRSHSSFEKVIYEDKAIDQDAEFSTFVDRLHKPVTQTDRLHVPRYHGRERTKWTGTPELKEDCILNNPKGGRQIPRSHLASHSPSSSYSSGSSPTSCHSGPPFMGTNFLRKARPAATEKRYTMPLLGGSNYVVCTHCSALLEIPHQFQFLKLKTIKFRCGRDSCFEIISYTTLVDSHTEHFQGSLAAEKLDEIFRRSHTMRSEAESTGTGDKGTPLRSLHLLMGYFSAKDILYDQSFRR